MGCQRMIIPVLTGRNLPLIQSVITVMSYLRERQGKREAHLSEVSILSCISDAERGAVYLPLYPNEQIFALIPVQVAP